MSILSSILGKGSDVEGPAAISPRTLLIGTAKTIRQMRNVLREADRPLHLVGALLLQPQHRAGAIGLPVLGTADQLDLIAHLHRIDWALICLPAAMSTTAGRLAIRCRELGLTVRSLPTLEDQLAGRSQVSSGPIDVSALLDRNPHQLDEQAIRSLLGAKRVLISGAGGSIGSELARIIARYQPAELLLMERGENNLFDIHRQLRSHHPELSVKPMLHDVTVESRTLALIRQTQPQIIFHAAAHKHVPMMEDHPREAVENNFFGTKAIADAAHDVKAERFVMISTDKAVNPTSVMGATKRLAELYIQDLNRRSQTVYTMVRFGNVLGSACSVIPIWTQQLAEGGPITVTDPRMTRYFMTIPEAAALVIGAATVQGAGGQVLLLDMGQPIKILDMAQRFIALHGLEADRDVQIVFTGARPGEKLFEELAYHSEAMGPTEQPGVRIWKTTPPDPRWMEQWIARFGELRHSEDRQAIFAALRQAIPEMRPPVEPLATPEPSRARAAG